MIADGAALMKRNRFLALFRSDHDFPNNLFYDCIILQHSLCCKMMNMQHMDICIQIVNFIQERSLHRRLFMSQLEENESEHGEILHKIKKLLM
jgi:hypothetical protein